MVSNLFDAITEQLPALQRLTLTGTGNFSRNFLVRHHIEKLLQECTALQYLSLGGDTLSLDVFSAGAELHTLHLSGTRVVTDTVLELLQVCTDSPNR
jgi:hypothetical protein